MYEPEVPFTICDKCNSTFPWDRETCVKCKTEDVVLRKVGKVKDKREFNVKVFWGYETPLYCLKPVECDYCASPTPKDNRISKYTGWRHDEQTWQRRIAYFSKYGFTG